jgi:hypothetical protein
MSKFWRACALILTATLMAVTMTTVHAAGNSDEQWTPAPGPNGEGWRSLYIQDNSTLNREPSALFAETRTPGGLIPGPSLHCATVNSDACVKSALIDSTAFLQPCSTEIIVNCIESLWATDSSDLRITAQEHTNYPQASDWTYKANDAMNLPEGGTPTVWTIPGVFNGGGTNTYMAQVYAESLLTKPAGSPVTTEKFVMNKISVAIIPVKLINGRYVQQILHDSTQTANKENRGVQHSSQDEWRYCAMVDFGTCQQKQSFPDGYRFGIRIRLQTKLTGWLHGRIYDPSITITNSSNGNQIIQVEAQPVQVPVIGEWFKWDELVQPIKDYILAGKVMGGQGDSRTRNLSSGNFQEMVATSGEGSMETLRLWLPQIKDKASASPTQWTFKNLTGGELQNSDKCIKDATDLAGFVTTNASVYSAGPPSFNAQTQSLDYKVISPHYTSKGEVAIGTYDLRIKSEVARCIYGFSKAPIQASISILSEDGSIQTATQTVQESEGWLSLSAKGFTYSSPTIQVKLSQQVAIAPIKEVPVRVKTSITCRKGKVTKVVTAYSPACPKGYSQRVSSTLK